MAGDQRLEWLRSDPEQMLTQSEICCCSGSCEKNERMDEAQVASLPGAESTTTGRV